MNIELNANDRGIFTGFIDASIEAGLVSCVLIYFCLKKSNSAIDVSRNFCENVLKTAAVKIFSKSYCPPTSPSIIEKL